MLSSRLASLLASALVMTTLSIGTASTASAAGDFELVTTLNVTFESDIVTSGDFVYVASDSDITIINAESQTVATTVSTSGALDPRGAAAIGSKVYFAASTSGNLIILDTITRSVSYLALTGCTRPSLLLPLNTVRLVVSCYNSSNVAIVNVTAPSLVSTVTTAADPRGLSKSGDLVFVPNSGANSVSVVNAGAATPTLVTTVAVGSQPEYTTYLDNKVYVANFSGNTVSILDATNPAYPTIATVAVGNNPQGIQPCDGNIYTANRWTGNTSVISPVTNTVTNTISLADVGAITHVMAVNGTYSYFLNYDRASISVVDCSNQTKVLNVTVSPNPYSIAFSSNYAFVTGVNTISVVSIKSSSTTSINDTQTPPDWMKQVARLEFETCEIGWNPSWAYWPNGGSGGFVCVQVLTWSRATQSYVVQG